VNVHFALGNVLFTYDLTRAEAVDDSLKTAGKAKADSARVKQETADSIKTLKARADSLSAQIFLQEFLERQGPLDPKPAEHA